MCAGRWRPHNRAQTVAQQKHRRPGSHVDHTMWLNRAVVDNQHDVNHALLQLTIQSTGTSRATRCTLEGTNRYGVWYVSSTMITNVQPHPLVVVVTMESDLIVSSHSTTVFTRWDKVGRCIAVFAFQTGQCF